MEFENCVVVITGGARGIGAALAKYFLSQGARGIVLSDIDENKLLQTANKLDATGDKVTAKVADVGSGDDVYALVEIATSKWGRLDIYCSNAGVMEAGGIDCSVDAWTKAWNINVMGHINAAKAAIPIMINQGGGRLLLTCSAAGLLTALGAAPYAVTKHASVALAEWLAITYGRSGIKVSALCPAAVDTDLLAKANQGQAASAVKSGGQIISPEKVAEIAGAGMRDDKFLVLTHPEVAEFAARKNADIERWLKGMQKFCDD